MRARGNLCTSFEPAHLYGLSPLCVRMCVVTLLDCENRRLHTEHRNGFSPEWVRQCAVKLAA